MCNRLDRGRCFSLLYFIAASVSATSVGAARAQVIWNGPPITFTQAAGADPSLAANQDRITPNVWITRGSAQGIYNAHSESGFTGFFSPQDTTWADGTTALALTLSYTDWNTWAKNVHGGPPNTVGVNAVVHLVSENIYLDLKFTSWGGVGGGFSYVRSTAAVPEPGSAALVASAGLIQLLRRRRRKGDGHGTLRGNSIP
jgi:hypothetical protein